MKKVMIIGHLLRKIGSVVSVVLIISNIASVSVLLESHIDTSEILSDEVFLSYL